MAVESDRVTQLDAWRQQRQAMIAASVAIGLWIRI